MLIHLIRHTTPEIEPGICYGISDLPLANSFEAERGLIHSKLNDRYDAVYSSPLLRCAKLSEFIESPIRMLDDRLIEYDFGDWELKPWSKLTDNNAQHWMDNFIEQAAPNGDSLLSMKKRVDDFWNELIHGHYKKVAITTHAGVIRIIHAIILEIPLRNVFRLQLDYGSVFEIHSHQDTGLQTIKYL